MKSKETADGRSTRWAEHRRNKKRELSSAALRAIRQRGPQVGMGEIAEVAGTSKTVYYRHFSDRAGLWSAVVDRSVDFIYDELPLSQIDQLTVPELIAELADSYLTLVEKDPEIYEFVTSRPGTPSPAEYTDPVVTLTARIAGKLAETLDLQGVGERSEIWAQAIVGAIWAIANRWMSTGRSKPKDEVVAQIRDLFAPGLSLHHHPLIDLSKEHPMSTTSPVATANPVVENTDNLSALGRDLRKSLDGKHHELKQMLRDNLTADLIVRPYDQSVEEARDWVMESIHKLVDKGFSKVGMPAEYGGTHSLSESIPAFEILAMGDLSLTIKSGVQQGLFGGAVLNLGDEEHKKKWLSKIITGELLGCYGMTELGRGSDVQHLETTITYIPETDEFEINTPDDDARKAYIGNAARNGRMAAVFGQLIVDGESQGVHCIMADVRDDEGNPAPGVTIGDHGRKGGLLGVDNGTLAFDHVRVPRFNLLNRYGKVDENGVYSSPIERRGQRFSTMLSTLVRGRICVGGAGGSATRRGLTIAVKHALARTQFTDPTGKPITIMNYQTHQKKLIPEVARAYAFGFAQNELIDHFQQVQDGADDKVVRELEGHAAGMKAVQTRWANDILQVCREACGGYGYMAENGLTTLTADADIFATFEGDNTVLLMLTGRGLLADFQSSWSELDMLDTARKSAALVGNRIVERTTARPTIERLVSIANRKSGSDILHARGWHVQMLEYREKRMVESLGLRMREVLKVDKAEQFEAFNSCQNHMIAASLAHMDRIILEAFVEGISETPEGEVRDTLIKLCDLYALSTIEEHRAWFLEHGTIDGGRSREITRAVEKLSAEIAENIEPIVEGLGVPEAWLNSKIAAEGK